MSIFGTEPKYNPIPATRSVWSHSHKGQVAFKRLGRCQRRMAQELKNGAREDKAMRDRTRRELACQTRAERERLGQTQKVGQQDQSRVHRRRARGGGKECLILIEGERRLRAARLGEKEGKGEERGASGRGMYGTHPIRRGEYKEAVYIEYAA
ncbi:hypothetical protein BJV74DRAFT_795005 [Russula compacta]|nr:hypothetical protein BJV74DRAFT_795005 [Russula compacta]